MKKIVALILAIALVITGLYPSQLVEAATTTTTGDGLDFNTEEYGYYVASKNLSVNPQTFEATVRLDTSKNEDGSYKYWNPGVIYSNTDKATPGTFEFGFTTGSRPYAAFIDDSGERVQKVFSIQTSENHNAIFRTGKFLHIAIVNDQTNDRMVCYLNGAQWATVSGAFKGTLTPSRPSCIGGDYREANTLFFKGAIKNIAVYSTAQTATNVKNHYKNGVSGSESGLLAAYTLGLTSNNALYPETISDLKGSYPVTRTRLNFMTEAEKEAVSPRPKYDYSMVVVGDPQVVTAHSANGNTPGEVDKIFQWILDNKESKKIQFAFNMGDTTDCTSGQDEEEWKVGSKAVKLLDGKVPYSIIRGNHDVEEKYLEYFSWNDYKDKVSGSYDNNMLNTYQKFEVGDTKYMVVNLDFGVSKDANEANAILKWANNVVAQNSEYNVIVTTHGDMDGEGRRMKDNDGGDPTQYGYAKSGQDIWDEFVKLHKNIVLLLNGHNGEGQVFKIEEKGVNGNNVVQLMVNPQSLDAHYHNSGYTMTGMIGMLYFSNGGKTVSFEYYSTLRDRYLNESNQFTFTLEQVDDSVIERDNGTLLLSRDLVNESGAIPVPSSSEYSNYLFAGWYSSSECTLETAITNKDQLTDSCYAKFIPKEILSVKAQVSTSKLSSGEYKDNWAMRFISSVEGIHYKSVGFKITDGSKEFTSSASDVYAKISSTEAETTYSFSPEVINKDSEYFFTAKLAIADTDAAKSKDYTVRAYIKTFDGTIVYGPERVICANDGLTNEYLNMVINADLPGTGYTASYKTGNYVNIDLAGGAVQVLSTGNGYSNVRIPNTFKFGTDYEMRSASKVIIKDASGTTVATEVYRNYYTTSHRGWDEPNADYSWHEVDTNADEFIIGSSADLYGFNTLISWRSDKFKGKTVRLIRDIVVNEGTAVRGTASSAPYWQPADGAKTYEWTSTCGDWGSSDNCFNGTFDGCGNTISGIVISKDTSSAIGLFGAVAKDAVIRNLGLTNSYIKASADMAGSIVGYSYAAKIENVYRYAFYRKYTCAFGSMVRWSGLLCWKWPTSRWSCR